MSKEIEVTFKGTITVPDCTSFSLNKAVSANVEKEDLGENAGKLVFIEEVRKSEKGYSGYANGEYFCVRQTPGILYCVKLDVGYGGHELKKFNLIGKDSTTYAIISSYNASSSARQFVKDQSKWLLDTDLEGKRQWVESVYSGARTCLRQVERALEATCQ